MVDTVKVVVDVEAVAALAETRLAQVLPRRWRHVRAVAQRARSVATTLSLPDDLLAAAWLHDIGYAPELAETGFHPLDGARFLRRAGVDGQVVSLVAYHSCAQIEADVRGLGAELAAEFTPADALLSDALLYCDMTTGPDGDYVRPADRLAEIREVLITAERVAAMLTAQARQNLPLLCSGLYRIAGLARVRRAMADVGRPRAKSGWRAGASACSS
jgi:hypothetical protein